MCLRFEQVTSVVGAAQCNEYLKSGWVVISTHLHARVAQHTGSRPSQEETHIVYVLGKPVLASFEMAKAIPASEITKSEVKTSRGSKVAV